MYNIDEYPNYDCDSFVLTSMAIKDDKVTAVNSMDNLPSKIKAENGKRICIIGGVVVII